MAQKINPRVDFAFKLIFTQHKDLLIALINAVVSEKDQVSDIEIRNPYTQKQYKTDKYVILDIKAQATDGTWFNIEVQVSDFPYYDKRTLYYWSKVYTEQIQEGAPLKELQKTIGIHLLNFDVLDEKDYHNVYHITNDKSGKRFSDSFEIHYIELEKVPEDYQYIQTALDRWGALLARAERYTLETLPKELACDETIKKAMEVFETTRMSSEDREMYEARLKWLRDEEAILDSKTNIARHSEKTEIAKAMLAKNMDIDLISELTGLSESEIEKF